MTEPSSLAHPNPQTDDPLRNVLHAVLGWREGEPLVAVCGYEFWPRFEPGLAVEQPGWPVCAMCTQDPAIPRPPTARVWESLWVQHDAMRAIVHTYAGLLAEAGALAAPGTPVRAALDEMQARTQVSVANAVSLSLTRPHLEAPY
jgi:hypothetical protein